MEKGTFAKYTNKIYRVSNIDGDCIRLVSEDQADLNNGFKEKVYPSNHKDSINLPRIYIKEIKKAEIDEIYEVDYKAKYKGNIFNLSFKEMDHNSDLEQIMRNLQSKMDLNEPINTTMRKP